MFEIAEYLNMKGWVLTQKKKEFIENDSVFFPPLFFSIKTKRLQQLDVYSP